MAACSFTGLTVSRGEGRSRHTVLHAISGEIPEGSAIALVGPNGAGKSTLLETLAGLHAQQSGSIHWSSPGPLARFQHAISLQTSGLPRQRSIDEFLHLMARLYSSARTPEEARAVVGLESDGRTRIKALSAGQAHRLRVAAAWISAAPVLLLDEPTSGVDAMSAAAIRQVIRGHVGTGGSVLISTHLLDDVVDCADAIWPLRDGHLNASLPRDSWHVTALTFTLDLPYELMRDVVPPGHQLTAQGRHWSIQGPDAHNPGLIADISDVATRHGVTVSDWQRTSAQEWWRKLMGGAS